MTALSFETFPPKSLNASFHLWDTVKTLAPLDPRFVSVTYGAGGSTRELTQESAQTLRKTSGLRVAAHLTCTDQSRTDVMRVAARYAAAGITDIVALRGDASKGGTFEPHPDGFANSVELINALAKVGQFNIRVGAYPDSHPDAASMAQNIDWLKAKIDAGATEAITQFFFEADTLLRFRDACAAAGIHAPINTGYPAGQQLGQREILCPALRHTDPGRHRYGVRSCHPRGPRRSLCADTVQRSVRHADLQRGRCAALLYAEPPRPDAASLPRTRAGARDQHPQRGLIHLHLAK